MCAAFERKGKGYRPGREVAFIGPEGCLLHVWAGFSRSEILDWWQSKGGVLVDIPADRFAERSNITGKLIWADVPQGLVLRGLLDCQGNGPLIKVVTRASSQKEEERFQHPRMPVLEAPIFAPTEIPEPEEETGFLF